MPELPEVQTVVSGLNPLISGATIEAVHLMRPNLRFPFPQNFAQRLKGRTIRNVRRRAKYILVETDDASTNLLSHLGMTGSFRFATPKADFNFEKHDHVIFELKQAKGPTPYLVYADPRRFGYLDLFEAESSCAHLLHLGPEPLGNHFSADHLQTAFAKRSMPIKSALLDQTIVAGLGNIYVCEALFRARIAPTLPANILGAETKIAKLKRETLVAMIRDILNEAIASGGSTLQDYRKVDGSQGYFQHAFSVYGREGESCLYPDCEGHIERLVQSGRSTFHCPICQSESL